MSGDGLSGTFSQLPCTISQELHTAPVRKYAGASVHRRPVSRPHVRQLLHRLQYPPPHGTPVHVATLQHVVGLYGSVNGGLGAVLVDEFVGGALPFVMLLG